MINRIINRIEKEIRLYIRDIDKLYSLHKLSPLLFKHTRDFLIQKGKRIRPLLFIIGYLGFTKNQAARSGLYRSAISMELLHDFAIVHDDIIDKSDTRRGKPSIHNIFTSYLSKYKNIKITGQDMAIILGDILYILSINALFSINEARKRKESALKKLTEAAMHTAIGQFLELLSGTKDIGAITKKDIYKIYDLKTAYYSFAAPLVIGAILAGAKKKEIDKLFRYGMYLGRAFQIKDDIRDIFNNENKSEKSTPADLRDAKRTILIWHAYHNSSKKHKLIIKTVLAKNHITEHELSQIRTIITGSKALDFAKNEISRLLRKAKNISRSSKMNTVHKNLLLAYSFKIIS